MTSPETPEEALENGRRDKLNALGMVRASLRQDYAGLLLQAREVEDPVGAFVSMASICTALLLMQQVRTGHDPEETLDKIVEVVVDP